MKFADEQPPNSTTEPQAGTPGAPEVQVLTIGHSNMPISGLVDLLREHCVHTVVDVRSAPYSRFVPQFNREALDAELNAVGVTYRFAGEHLGGRPTDPTCYFSGQVPGGKANYLELVNYPEVATRPWFRLGLKRLMQLAAERTTAVLCSEEDPFRCHRHRLIARAIMTQGGAVQHIRGTGVLENAASTDERIRRKEGMPQLDLFVETS